MVSEEGPEGLLEKKIQIEKERRADTYRKDIVESWHSFLDGGLEFREFEVRLLICSPTRKTSNYSSNRFCTEGLINGQAFRF